MKSHLLTFLSTCAAAAAIAQADVRVVTVLPSPYLKPGTYTFIPGIENKGSRGGGIRVWWQLDNGPVQSAAPKMPTAILASVGTSRFESDSFTFTVTKPGISRLKVWTTFLTPGVTESNPRNDTLIQTYKVYNELPDKRVILEIYKHQRCGPCYPAAEFNKQFIKPMTNHTMVNLYTDPTDVLYNADARLINEVYGFAHPAPVFDRFRFPYLYDITTGYYMENNVYKLRELGRRDIDFEPLDVSIAMMHLDTSSRILKCRLRAKAYDTLSGDLRFNLWITEDSVKGLQASAPDENNYWHANVLRSFAGGPWGKQGSLPGKLLPGQSYYYDFQYTVPATYKLRHLQAIGLVQAYSKDSMARRILNSVEAKATRKLGVGTRDVLADVTAYPIPARDLLQFRINAAISLEGLRLTIRTSSGQLVRDEQVRSHQQAVSLQGLAAGTYVWSLQGAEAGASKVFTKTE